MIIYLQKKYLIKIGLPVLLFLFTLSSALAYVPTDPLYSQQEYLKQINIEGAWDVSEGKGAVVAVLDSGVDIDHPDLKLNIWHNQDEIAGDGIDNDSNGYIDDVNGWDYINNIPDPRPKFEEGYTLYGMDHGTAVAGLIAAVANNGTGIVGIAFNAKIMPLRVLGANGVGDVATLIRAIRYAVYNGADVINLSLVGNTPSDNLNEVIGWANKKGVVVVAATGNATGANSLIDLNDNPTYPACYGAHDGLSNILISVSSVDINNVKSIFATYGSDCVDIVAPGESLLSLAFYNKDNTDYNNYYAYGWSGTSLSAAMVSGVAALVKAKDRSLAPQKIISALRDTAENIYSNNLGYSNQLGTGRLDAARTLDVFRSSIGYVAKLNNYPAVYYIKDGVRHLFSNEATYWSWYRGTWADQGVRMLPQDEFDLLALGVNVTSRPGANLVRFENSPRVYAVTSASTLCRFENNNAAQSLYGDAWKDRLITIQNVFEVDYTKDSSCIITSQSRYPASSLIQYSGSSDIWFIDGPSKRLVVNQKAFVANDWQEKFIVKNVSPDVPYLVGSSVTGFESNIFSYVK